MESNEQLGTRHAPSVSEVRATRERAAAACDLAKERLIDAHLVVGRCRATCEGLRYDLSQESLLCPLDYVLAPLGQLDLPADYALPPFRASWMRGATTLYVWGYELPDCLVQFGATEDARQFAARAG